MDGQQAITQKRLRREILKLKTYLTEPTNQPILLKRRTIRIPQQVVQSSLLQPPALPLQDAQPQPQPPEEFIVDLTEGVPLVSAVPDYDRKKEELLSNSCMEYWLSEHYNLMIVRHRSIEIDVRKFKTLAPNHYLCDDIIDCHF